MNAASLLQNKNKVKKSTSEQVVHTIVFVIFTLVAFSYLYLIFWCIHSGMRTNSAIANKPFGFGEYSLKNYVDVFEIFQTGGTSFAGMIVNSVYFSFLGPFLTIFIFFSALSSVSLQNLTSSIPSS